MNLLLLLVSFLVLASVLVNGMPPIGREYNTHCRCQQVESRIIPPDALRSIKIYPRDAHCHDTEVVAGLVGGERICLDPRSPWVIKLLRFIFRRPQDAPK